MTSRHGDIRRAAAIGMFDGVHLGHRFLIECLQRSAQDRIIPTVFTFANHPLSVVNPAKAPRLLTLPDEKERLLRDIGTDVVMLSFDDKLRSMTAGEFIAMLSRDYGVVQLLRGFNNRFGSDRVESAEEYRAIAAIHNVGLISADEYRPGRDTVSSTAIRRALDNGDVESAAYMLGRPYTLTGTVEAGHQLGRTIGYPTANIRPLSPVKAVPSPGVYAADIECPDNIVRRAIVNIGRRPTVENSGEIRIEAHIDDFHGDLYGTSPTLRFLRRLRDERRFGSLDLLREQLDTDIAAARNI